MLRAFQLVPRARSRPVTFLSVLAALVLAAALGLVAASRAARAPVAVPVRAPRRARR